jgi:hypothetical protein
LLRGMCRPSGAQCFHRVDHTPTSPSGFFTVAPPKLGALRQRDRRERSLRQDNRVGIAQLVELLDIFKALDCLVR